MWFSNYNFLLFVSLFLLMLVALMKLVAVNVHFSLFQFILLWEISYFTYVQNNTWNYQMFGA